jgi:LPS-assembly protein
MNTPPLFLHLFRISAFFVAVFIICLSSILPSLSTAQASDIGNQNAPVDMIADELIYNDKDKILTAKGNVQLKQNGRTLTTDHLIYNMTTDTIEADGLITITDQNGDVHKADFISLSDQFKNGLIRQMRSVLADGSRFWAKQAHRKNGDEYEMKQALYSPCPVCEGKSPLWSLKARTVNYQEKQHRVEYRHATLRLKNIPIFYLPYFTHSDGKIDRKSGLLTPRFGYDSQLGGTVTEAYYIDIAPDQDATFGVLTSTQELPMAFGEYRKRFETASFDAKGSSTYSGRIDQIGGQTIPQNEEWRGHLFAKSLWDVNDKWRMGSNIELTSDEQYLRQYDLDNKDILENQLYAERFEDRNYFVGRTLLFQDTRVTTQKVDQPAILPELVTRVVADPNSLWGGRLAGNLSFLGLNRDGSGQDMQRVVGSTDWYRRFISSTGFVGEETVNLRGDVYQLQDSLPLSQQSQTNINDKNITRGFVQSHSKISYPLAKPVKNGNIKIDPTVALTLSNNLDNQNRNVPNEDSQDIQIDYSNIFNENRFPGLDQIEDDTRLTYGANTGYYDNNGSHISTFIGQSYRFDSSNIFPTGSGLSQKASDIVGQMSADYQGQYGMNYRYQVSSETLKSNRQEINAYRKWDNVKLGGRYFYSRAFNETDLEEDREQVAGTVGFKLSKHWGVEGAALYDLAAADSGLRQTLTGLTYNGDCINSSFSMQRNLTSAASGDSGTSVFLRVGLKNLGQFNSNGADRTIYSGGYANQLNDFSQP